jgi:hypothetical protein
MTVATPRPSVLEEEVWRPYKREGSCSIEGDLPFSTWHLDLGYSFFNLAPCKKPFCTSRAFVVQYRKAGVGVLPSHESPKPGKITVSISAVLVCFFCADPLSLSLVRIGSVCSPPVFDTFTLVP